MIAAIVDELVAEPCGPAIRSATSEPPSFSLRPATIPKDCGRRPASRVVVRRQPPFRRPRERPSGIASTPRAEIRAANSALHIIAIGRLRTDQRTKDYVTRRIAEGHSKLDAIRALKRYLAREVFTLITLSVTGRSTLHESPLDKQKGVQGSTFTAEAFTSKCL